jgi:hypothetical protein
LQLQVVTLGGSECFCGVARDGVVHQLHETDLRGVAELDGDVLCEGDPTDCVDCELPDVGRVAVRPSVYSAGGADESPGLVSGTPLVLVLAVDLFLFESAPGTGAGTGTSAAL